MFDVAFARVVLGALAGWLSQRQQEAIAYLTEENRILRRQLRGRRLRLTDDERRTAAAVAVPADTNSSDVLLTYLSTPEVATILDLYTVAQTRMERGDAPLGGAVRSVIVPPLATRIHMIERVIVAPPAYDKRPPSNGRDEPRGDE